MKRIADRAVWMRARATNALRRPLAIGTIGGVLGLLVFAGLLLVPERTERAATVAVAAVPERPDTATAARVRDQAVERITVADSLMDEVRREAAIAAIVPPDTFPPYLVARRDTLRAAIATLSSGIARAQSAPLPSSYRVLGESRPMWGVAGVPDLLGELSVLEREREMFGAVSGVDPAYIAHTARVNAIGRSIIAAAEGRRSALRADLARILPPPAPERPILAAVDTLRVLADRAEAQGHLLRAEEELQRLRERHREIDAIERRAREMRGGAPIPATFGAALVIGLAIGFAFTFFSETRRPRVADMREAERVTRLRVLAVARPRTVVPERDRRGADVAVPEVLDPFAEHYRRMYLHLTTREDPVSAVTITADDPDLAAVVAVNLAAYDVREARSAIVVDTDPLASGVARALGVASEPGLTDVLQGDVGWPDVVQYVNIGRDQMLAVMPSGRRAGKPSVEGAARVREDLQRLSSRHDLIVFAAAVEQVRQEPASVLLSPDVVLCARLGYTRIRTLRAMVEQLRSAGMNIHGLLLWDAESPGLPARPRASGGRRSEPAREPAVA